MIKTADLPENAIKHMRVAVMLALVAILLLVVGCASVFDSELKGTVTEERRGKPRKRCKQ